MKIVTTKELHQLWRDEHFKGTWAAGSTARLCSHCQHDAFEFGQCLNCVAPERESHTLVGWVFDEPVYLENYDGRVRG